MIHLLFMRCVYEKHYAIDMRMTMLCYAMRGEAMLCYDFEWYDAVGVGKG